jgi:hypothetical protein
LSGSTDIEQRVIDAVRRSARQPARSESSRRALGPLLIAGAVASVALVALVLRMTPFFRAAEKVRPAALAAVELTADETMSPSGWERVQPEAIALLEGEPLRREVDAVYADARSALGFLALNFLPDSTQVSDSRETSPNPRRRQGSG